MSRILIVEDDANQRELYRQELCDEGYEVVTRTNGEEALEYLQHERPDLVILDICMPGIDGLDLLSRVLEKDRLLPVILNTAYSQFRENYLTWRANAYVVKSGDLSELKTRVAELMSMFAPHK